MKKRCEFYKDCEYYDPDNPLCNENEGFYYEDQYAGCYRKLWEEKNK